MSKLKVSVIIPTYNRSNQLKRTLESLINIDYPEEGYEIIVVDNGSKDNTKEIVNTFMQSYSNIRYIYESKPGLHNARHSGAKNAEGDILLYIDDDVVVDRNLLSEIINQYNEADVGCVGGKILPKWEVEPPEWIKQIPKSYLSILDDEDGPKEVQWIYGCNFSIRKDLLFELGGFNPDAFGDKKMWWYRADGEIGLLRKVHSAGKKVIYNPEAVVWHFIPKSRLTVAYFKERAYKSGIEASYSKFRYSKKMSSQHLFVRAIAFFGLYLLNALRGSILLKAVKAKVNSAYFKARFLYELKLVTDKKLRDIVKQKTYLEI